MLLLAAGVFSDMNAVAVAQVNAGPTAADAGGVAPKLVATVVNTVSEARRARAKTARR